MNIKQEAQYHLEPGVVIFTDGHKEECQIICPHTKENFEFRCESGRFSFNSLLWTKRNLRIKNHYFSKYSFENDDWYVVEDLINYVVEGTLEEAEYAVKNF